MNDKESILEVILSCVKSEAYLCDFKKEFLITDINEKHIISVLKAVDYNFKSLLELNEYLRELMSRKEWEEEQGLEDKEHEKFLDEEWISQNGDDACDNCGYSRGRNHDCDDAVCDDFNEEREKQDLLNLLTIDDFIIKIIKRLEDIKKEEINNIK